MSKKIVLKSSDGESFEVDERVALESHTIKHMIKDDCGSNVISLSNVTSNILAKVIEYCKKHVEATTAANASDTLNDELKAWDTEFVNVDQPTLFSIMLAAYYLDIKGLVDLTCQTVADMMTGKSTQEIRTLFNIESDYTPEEEEEARRDINWTFD